MLRRLGLVCFAVGASLFFADRYLSGLLFFAAPTSQIQAAVAVGTYYVVQLAGLALIVAGAVMFIVSRRKQKLAANS